MKSVGFIGCGTVVHANYARTIPALRYCCTVQYVCDLNEAQARSAAEIFGAKVVTIDELLQKSDVVVITTPPSTHVPLVEKSLAANRIVICEKPFVTTAADARRLTELAASTGAKLYVGHFRRTFPQARLARQLVRMGVIGAVQAITASEGGRFTWNAVSDYINKDKCGGVLWDTGSHTLDMSLFAADLDRHAEAALENVVVQRDRPEPSHDFRASFRLTGAGQEGVGFSLHLSRKEALPNFIRIAGERGNIIITLGLDTNVRLTMAGGTVVLPSAEPAQQDYMQYFEMQLRRMVLNEAAEDFEARNFELLSKIIETLAHA